jgi:hypothetical protein
MRSGSLICFGQMPKRNCAGDSGVIHEKLPSINGDVGVRVPDAFQPLDFFQH